MEKRLKCFWRKLQQFEESKGEGHYQGQYVIIEENCSTKPFRMRWDTLYMYVSVYLICIMYK